MIIYLFFFFNSKMEAQNIKPPLTDHTMEMLPVRCYTCNKPLFKTLDEFEKNKREAGFDELKTKYKGDELRLEEGRMTAKILGEMGYARECCRQNYVAPTVYALRMDETNIPKISPGYQAWHLQNKQTPMKKIVAAPIMGMRQGLGVGTQVKTQTKIQASAVSTHTLITDEINSSIEPVKKYQPREIPIDWKFTLKDTSLLSRQDDRPDMNELLKSVPLERQKSVAKEIEKALGEKPYVPLTADDLYEYRRVGNVTIRKYVIN